jgi:NADPH2:quinone reductase
LQKVAKLVDEEKLVPLIGPLSFSIAEAAKAHKYLESGKAKDKVALSANF